MTAEPRVSRLARPYVALGNGELACGQSVHASSLIFGVKRGQVYKILGGINFLPSLRLAIWSGGTTTLTINVWNDFFEYTGPQPYVFNATETLNGTLVGSVPYDATHTQNAICERGCLCVSARECPCVGVVCVYVCVCACACACVRA